MRRFVTTALCLCLSSSAFAQSPAEYRVPRAAEPPKLDGILDDQVWTQAADADRAMGLVQPESG